MYKIGLNKADFEKISGQQYMHGNDLSDLVFDNILMGLFIDEEKNELLWSSEYLKIQEQDKCISHF